MSIDFKAAVIFDLDGTMADVRHRLPLIKTKPKNWPEFFNRCVDDTPIEHVHWLWHAINKFLRVDEAQIVCSGRPDSHRNETENWFRKLGVRPDMLKMRKAGDTRPDTVVKKEMLDEIRGLGMRVLFAVDDRPEVIKMWRENGVPVFAVEGDEWFADLEDRVAGLLTKYAGEFLGGPNIGPHQLAAEIVALCGR